MLLALREMPRHTRPVMLGSGSKLFYVRECSVVTYNVFCSDTDKLVQSGKMKNTVPFSSLSL